MNKLGSLRILAQVEKTKFESFPPNPHPQAQSYRIDQQKQ